MMHWNEVQEFKARVEDLANVYVRMNSDVGWFLHMNDYCVEENRLTVDVICNVTGLKGVSRNTNKCIELAMSMVHNFTTWAACELYLTAEFEEFRKDIQTLRSAMAKKGEDGT